MGKQTSLEACRGENLDLYRAYRPSRFLFWHYHLKDWALKMESTKRRFPKVLADEITSALSAVEELDHEQQMEFLRRYRRNRARHIAAWGLLTPDAPVHGLEHIPHEWHSKIADLDAAWTKIHSYRDGGAEDYVAAYVMKEINKVNSRKRRTSTFTDEELNIYISRRHFKDSTDKTSIISAAAEHFEVTTKTIQRRIAKLAPGH